MRPGATFTLTEEMGGSIELESGHGRGPTFTARFAVSCADPGQATAQDVDYRGDAKILVIDDLKSRHQLASRMLGALGYQITTAVDVGEGMQILAQLQSEVDLVIIDRQWRALPTVSIPTE